MLKNYQKYFGGMVMKNNSKQIKSSNPIGKVGLFATPESMDSFQDYLGKFTGSEAVVANTCAFMAWNLASKIIDELLEENNCD